MTAAAPPKKKGTLKQKLAEKEAARRAQLAAGGSEADYDEDAVLDPREKARLEKERELESDLRNATELFSSTTIKGASPPTSRHFIFSDTPMRTRRLCRCGSGQNPKIVATVQRGLCRALGCHHRAYSQTAPGQAAVCHVRRTPRARASPAPA